MTTLTANTIRLRLWAEFALLFVGVPLVMAATFGSYSLFGVVWALAAVAGVLLVLTPGFEWKMLLRGPVFGEWRILVFYSVVTALVCAGFVLALVPERFLGMPWSRTGLWLMIMVLYPILSAWPQELIYRSLFFERYGGLFPTATVAIIANGLVFGFGHLFFMNPVTIAMTAAGGAFMGWAYLRNRSMLFAWILHAIAGNLIFTLGLGAFFYHGAVG